MIRFKGRKNKNWKKDFHVNAWIKEFAYSSSVFEFWIRFPFQERIGRITEDFSVYSVSWMLSFCDREDAMYSIEILSRLFMRKSLFSCLTRLFSILSGENKKSVVLSEQSSLLHKEKSFSLKKDMSPCCCMIRNAIFSFFRSVLHTLFLPHQDFFTFVDAVISKLNSYWDAVSVFFNSVSLS
jgi:hypothetical protein